MSLHPPPWSPARPPGVALLAIAHWLLAAVLLPIGLLGSGAALRGPGVSVIALLAWATLLLVSVVLAALGLGLWRMRRGAYQLALTLYSLTIAGNLASGIERGMLAGAGPLITLVLVVYLWRQRQLFR